MKIKRIMPKLDIKGPNLVKKINYEEGLRVLGNPEHFIKKYYKNGTDKVFVNSAALKKPNFIDEAVKHFEIAKHLIIKKNIHV